MIFSRLIACAALTLVLASCGDGNREVKTERVVLPTIGTSGGALSNRPARPLFATRALPSAQAPNPIGNHSKGCLAGGVELPETGPTWQAMRLSRNRNWSHPQTIDFLKKLSAVAAAQPGWEGLYIGDLSQPRGGPVSGHVSHQSGLDADIWMLPPKRLNLTRGERESLSSISTRRAKGAYVNSNWTRGHHEILKAAAKDPRVTRIFVFPGAKVQMCDDETGDKSWLRKIRPWYGHHYHFHIRFACPAGDATCTEQDAPPPGNGCEEAREWQRNILNPPPPDPNAKPPKPRQEVLLADLPLQCKAVLDN